MILLIYKDYKKVKKLKKAVRIRVMYSDAAYYLQYEDSHTNFEPERRARAPSKLKMEEH